MDLTKVRAFFGRVFFWLGNDRKSSEEQLPESARDHAMVLAVTKPTSVPGWRQLRYASRVLSVAEQRILTAALLACGFFVISAAVVFAWQNTVLIPASGGVYTEALIGEPSAINPIDAPSNETDADLTSLIYSGLYRMQGIEPTLDLAESASWSEDGKTLSVTLRPDARFHNGAQVTADDVQFTIEAAQDPTRNSLLEPLFRGVTVAVQDPRTIQFTLSRPDATFPIALTIGIMPAVLWQDIPAVNARLANLNVKPIGSGPYAIKSFTRDQRGSIMSYTLERWEGYYGIKPHIKTLAFQFYPDFQSAEDAIKSDLVDGLAFVPPAAADRFKSASRWNLERLEIPQQTIAFFNTKDKTLQDVRVRQALALAVARPDLIAALGGFAAAAEFPYPFESSASSTAGDLDGARALLQATGWVLPANENVRIRQASAPKPNTPAPAATASSTRLTLTIIVPDQPDLQKIAEALQRQWSLLGAQVEVEPMSVQEVLRKSTHERNAQIILWNVLLGPDQDLLPIWWSGQAKDRGTNFSSLADKDVDLLIDQTKSSSSTAALVLARTKLSQALLQRAPAAFLVRPQYTYVLSTRVKGVPDASRIAKPSDRFNGIASWYVKTGFTWK